MQVIYRIETIAFWLVVGIFNLLHNNLLVILGDPITHDWDALIARLGTNQAVIHERNGESMPGSIGRGITYLVYIVLFIERFYHISLLYLQYYYYR